VTYLGVFGRDFWSTDPSRGFLCWDRRDLSRKSAVPLSTIERIETAAKITDALVSGLSALQKALETEGIEFIDGEIPGAPTS
jgi:hypothetical protein